MSGTCSQCGGAARRLRKDLCDACYMRQYRGGTVEAGARCAGCGERRRQLLGPSALGVLCGNCQLVVAKTRPRIDSIDRLRALIARERRAVRDRRGEAPAAVGGRRERVRRRADRRLAPVVAAFDPAVD